MFLFRRLSRISPNKGGPTSLLRGAVPLPLSSLTAAKPQLLPQRTGQLILYPVRWVCDTQGV